MDGKIKLKLNQKSSIFNNRYEIFINDNFIGFVDYKNPKIDFITNFGNHKITVKGKDFEKEHNFTLTSRQIILPIEINENMFWSKSDYKLPKIIKGVILGFIIAYSILLLYLFASKKIEFGYPLLIPFFIILFINSTKQNNKFELSFK